MAEPVPDDGEPLRIGDLITLFDKQLGAFCCADGFNISSLMYLSGKDGQPSEKDTRCLFRIGPKLGYQQRKRYKKILSNIGVSSIDELESFMEEEDVAEDEVQELEALHCRGGPLEKEDKENQEEMERMRGQEVVYGTAIQLQHVNSDSWVTLMKGAGLQPGSTKIEVTRDGGEGSWFNVMPGYKVRKEGDKVVVTDQVMLTSTKKSTPERQLYVHTYREEGCEQDHRDAGMPPSLGEINAFETRTRFEVLRYSAFDQGGDVLCSGDIVRLLHKEEEGFLTLGQVGGYQSDSTKIHVLKHKAGTNAPTKGAFTCSNSLWRLEQMNVTSISGLLERRAENLPDPDEKGGNATWEQLYRIRHKGSGLYMAASFDSSMPTRGTGAARGPVRFYFTDLQADEAYLETLWSIKPVNPKPDNGVPIGMKEGFHLQHAATMYWIHAKTAEASSVGMYFDANEATKFRKSERMIEMVAEKPYEDAFGVFVDERTHMEEVVDVNYTLEIKPELESYLDLLSKQNISADSRHNVSTKHVTPAKRLLSDFILNFITKGDSILDPLLRESTVHSEGRQQLLREQGVLDVLARLTSEPKRKYDIPYDQLKSVEPNVFSICVLANKLVRHALRDNIPNCLYFQKYIPYFQAQIGEGTDATSVLLALHKDNKELLEKLEPESFETWTKLMVDAIDRRKIVGRIASSAMFLTYTCLCNEDEAIRDNQNAITTYLFQPELPNPDRLTAQKLVCKFTMKAAGDVKVINVADRQERLIEEVFAKRDRVPTDAEMPKFLEDDEMQKFIMESIVLYSNICAGRNNESIEIVSEYFPELLVLDVIMTERAGCEQLRAAFCNLFVRIYVDCGDRSDAEPVQLTRVWDDVDPLKIDLLATMDEEPFVNLKNWIVQFLTEDDHQFMRCSESQRPRNILVVAVIKLAYRMLQFRVYCTQESIRALLVPLLNILDGTSDRSDIPGEDRGQSWRFEEKLHKL